MEVRNQTIKVIDNLIFIFFILFILSLTNSIFINQLGYYGALVFILARYFLTKNNQFKKTGLELAFIWFILAEILSSVFSDYSSASFNNVLKRALLIPIVYTTIAAVSDLKKGNIFFKIYIGASLVTVLIYLYFAYQHYIQNLYGITESGPSIFQYPITASEIISFTAVYLFAFLINEKVSIKNRIFIFIAFALSLAALISTYKRTGWLGAAAGIFVILLIKKQWKILLPVLLGGVVVVLLQKNISEVIIYNYSNGTLSELYKFSTEGRAYDIYTGDDYFFVSDYENGLLKYKDSIQVEKYEFPAPVSNFIHWKDNFYLAALIDTRFILLKKGNDSLHPVKQFITKGFTVAVSVFNNYLYILDSDSGLTIYRDPENISDKIIYKELNGFRSFFIDSAFIVLFSPNRNIKVLFNQYNYPGKTAVEYKHNKKIDFLNYFDKKLFITDDDGLKIYNVDKEGVGFVSASNNIKQVFKWIISDDKIFAASTGGTIYELEYPVENSIKILSKNNIDFTPYSFDYNEGTLFTSKIEFSRLLSIWDPYHPSNTVRLALWQAGWEMVKDHPIFGVGDIDLREYYSIYKKYYNKEIQGHMHNNYVHILVTLGFLGLLAFLHLSIKIALIDLRIYNKVKDKPFISSYALGTVSAYAAFLLAGMTELNFGDHEIITLIWFTFGLNIAFYNFEYDNKYI